MQFAVHFVFQHPWILWLMGFPAFVASVPSLLHGLEVRALKGLVSQGDEIDQKAVKATISVWVTWAEEKYGAGRGAIKFDAVEMWLSKALPFMSEEQRHSLIEESVKAMDQGAREVAGTDLASQAGNKTQPGGNE